jgi:hypothetical protein
MRQHECGRRREDQNEKVVVEMTDVEEQKIEALLHVSLYGWVWAARKPEHSFARLEPL